MRKMRRSRGNRVGGGGGGGKKDKWKMVGNRILRHVRQGGSHSVIFVCHKIRLHC